MPRGRKTAKPVNRLLEALAFISVAQSAKSDMSRYCMCHQNQVVAFDGIISAGCPIDESLECCPETNLFKIALSSAGEEYVITHMPDNRLELASGEYRVSIPLSSGQGLCWRSPAPRMGILGNAVRDAIKIVGALVNEKGTKLIEACAVLSSQSVAATDRNLVLEAFHGFELPTSFLIPKAFIKAVSKQKKILTGFGYTETSLTFWYDDDSWIQTQIYVDPIPDVRRYFKNFSELNWYTAPSNLIDAVMSIYPFSQGEIITNGNLIQAYTGTIEARQAVLSGDMPHRIYNGDRLLAAAPYMLYFNADGGETYFHKNNIRGVIGHKIAGEKPKAPIDETTICEHGIKFVDCGECIPF